MTMKSDKQLAENEDQAKNPTDLYVGMRVRMRRIILGLSVQELAVMTGESLSCIEKIEAGCERIGASRLHQFSQLLDVPVAWFFDGIGVDGDVQFGGVPLSSSAVTVANREKQDLELLKFHYQQIKSNHLRRTLIQMARMLAEGRYGKAS